MKDFNGLVLCDERSERVDVHVRADLTDGKLTFSGHDLGPFVEGAWGDDEYEYWYGLDEENTKKLFAVIDGEEDPEAALLRRFSGPDGCSELRDVCDENGIKYAFNCYV